MNPKKRNSKREQGFKISVARLRISLGGASAVIVATGLAAILYAVAHWVR